MKSEGSSPTLSMLSRKTRLEAFCWLVTIILRSVKQNSHSAMVTMRSVLAVPGAPMTYCTRAPLRTSRAVASR
eukprot:957176-Heterocapsa_arctica.AAC.1